jgi:hypothetical protein
MTDLTTSKNRWLFEEKVVRAIRAESYGSPYDAQVFINIVNGQAHVETMLSKCELTRADFREIERELKRRGFEYYYYSRFKHGQRRLIKKRIK